LTNRDGIVGTWRADNTELPTTFEKDVGDTSLLDKWTPSVRAYLLDSDLHPRINLDILGKSSAALCVRCLDENGQPKNTSLASFTRPQISLLRKQLDLVAGYSDLRADRGAEIIAQLGTPEHFFGTIVPLQAYDKPYTLELLATAMRFVAHVVMLIKHALAVPRPDEFTPQIQPMIPTPGHGSLPSGHATEAFMFATTLCRLLDAAELADVIKNGTGEQLYRQASRIAVNRTVAGVHYPIDSIAGAALGVSLGNLLASVATDVESNAQAMEFKGRNILSNQDFDWREIVDPKVGKLDSSQYLGVNKLVNPQKKGRYLSWLWDRALAEWKQKKEDDSGDDVNAGDS
jgi:hypothetical protein